MAGHVFGVAAALQFAHYTRCLTKPILSRLNTRCFAATRAANATTAVLPHRLEDLKILLLRLVRIRTLLVGPGKATNTLAHTVRAPPSVCTPHALKRRLLHHQLEPPGFKCHF